jgi:hypothetical protein
MSRKSSTVGFELKMSLNMARAIMASSVVTAVGCVACTVQYGAFDYASMVLFVFTVSGVLAISYAAYDKKEQTFGLLREYIIVFAMVTLIASVAATGYEYGTHRAWNSFPLFVCAPLMVGMGYVLRRVMRNFKLTIGRDCFYMMLPD